MGKLGKIYIGTSGYSYPHWQGIFYPKNLPQAKWLEYYAKYFGTVELNVTFYRLPQKAAFDNWYQRVPENFVFVCKGSRYITHIKKLKGVKRATKLFFQRVELLKEKNGLILWQLPPSFKIDLQKLEDFLKILQDYKLRNAIEFRHPSWFKDQTYKLLGKYKVALCVADSDRYPRAEEVTTDFVYFRFHGGKSLYASNYSLRELKSWAIKIKKWQKQGLDVYVYFNNDARGYAVKNAKTLIRMYKPRTLA